MYRVDVYLRVRRAVMVDGMSVREAARVFGLHRDTVRKMLAYSVPPGLSPAESAKEAQAGALHRRHRPDPRERSKASQETAPHCQAHLRAPQGRIRIRRRIHHGQGLRQRESPSDQGDVRAAVPCAKTRPDRLWRGPGGHRRVESGKPTASSSICPTATGRPLPFHRTANPSDCAGLRAWECGPSPMQGDGPVCLIRSLSVTYA